MPHRPFHRGFDPTIPLPDDYRRRLLAMRNGEAQQTPPQMPGSLLSQAPTPPPARPVRGYPEPPPPTGFGQPPMSIWEGMDIAGKHTLGNVMQANLTDPRLQPEQHQQVVDNTLNVTADISPGIGEVRAFQRMPGLMDEGKWGSAIFEGTTGLLGLLPYVGGVLQAGARGGRTALRNLMISRAESALDQLPRRTRAETAAHRRLERHTASPEAEARRDRAIARGQTPEEAELLANSASDVRANVQRFYSLLPTPRAFAEAAIRGSAARGWYKGSGQTIRQLFGEVDAPRATALIAAQSPNKSVEENLRYSLATWRNWVNAGRPTDPDVIRRLSPRETVEYIDKGKRKTKQVPTADAIIQSPLQADYENTIRALTATDEVLAKGDPHLLSGPKVGPFYANLLGAVLPVTNDTHMARGYGTKPSGVGSVARTLAQNAMIGNAAIEFERITGVPVDRREIQEMTWAFIRGLTNAAGKDGNALHVLEESLLNPDATFIRTIDGQQVQRTLHDEIADAVPMGELLAQPQYADVIAEIGLPTPIAHPPTGVYNVSPFAANPNAQRDIAERLQLVRTGNPIYSLAPFLAGGVAAQYMMPRQEFIEPQGPFPDGYR